MGAQAFYRLSARVLTRSKGHTSVGYAAYLAAEKLRDDRYRETRHYAKQRFQERLFDKEILAPENAPDWVYNRQELHNRIEAAERRKDSQLVREVTLSFPKELNHQQKQEAARRFVQSQYVSKGMVADISYHNFEGRDDHNPHAHVLLTMRRLEKDGFAKKKEQSWQPEFSKKYHTAHAQGDLLTEERKEWEKHLNHQLQRAGRTERVDCRSLQDRGIDKLPEPKKGKAHQMAQRSGWQGDSRALDAWQEVREINQLKEEHNKTLAELAELQNEVEQLRIQETINRGHEYVRQQQAKAKQEKNKGKISDRPLYKHAAEEFKQAEQDERALLKQLLDQQADRERDKSRSSGSKSPSHEQERDGNLEQKLANLKSAMTEFSASVEELKQTTAKPPKRKKQPPRSPPENQDHHHHQPKR